MEADCVARRVYSWCWPTISGGAGARSSHRRVRVLKPGVFLGERRECGVQWPCSPSLSLATVCASVSTLPTPRVLSPLNGAGRGERGRGAHSHIHMCQPPSPAQEHQSPRGPCDGQWPNPLSLPPQLLSAPWFWKAASRSSATSTPGQRSPSAAPQQPLHDAGEGRAWA